MGLNRFGYMRPSWEGSDVSYGYYRALIATFKYFGPASAMSNFVLGGKLTHKLGFRTLNKLYKKNSETGKYEAVENVDLGDFWERRIHHTRMDAMMIFGFLILSNAALARVRQKRDDDEELSILEGNAFRVLWGVRGETVAMNPFAGGSKEYIKNFTQGIPFLREFNMMHDAIKQTIALTYVLTTTGFEAHEPDPDTDSQMYQNMYKDAYYQKKSGSNKAGDIKLFKKAMDLTGLKNIRNLINPDNMIEIMKRNQ
jgi:hypothetical protein